MAKYYKIGIIVLAALVIAGLLWFKTKDRRDAFSDVRDMQRVSEELEAEYEALRDEYRNDPYGGETPEETLELFISALEAGDTDLAAKYFIPEKQLFEADRLRGWEESKHLNTIISELKTATISSSKENEATMIVLDESGVVEIAILFIKNPYTNKWKIESL